MPPHEIIQIIPLDPDEFFAAHEYASMVAESEFLEEIPVLGSKLRCEEGTFSFANVAENRYGFAVMKFFRGRKYDKGWSYMVRFFAMTGVMRRLADHEQMQRYIKKEQGGNGRFEFHRAIFDVAATQTLNNEFEFSHESFLEAVKQTAARMDASESRVSREKSGAR